MASNLNPRYAYTVVYVRDAAKSVAFYAKAFSYQVRRLDHSNRRGELESGKTTIALTYAHQHKTDDLSGEVCMPQSSHERNPIENAVENDVVPVSEPEEKEWRQKVGYVRDIDGIVVRMGSYMNSSKAYH
ncbi:Hypothetical predicted protein [Olea europaea subsp. europaea]|uniref:Glyoxalase/fosfomycin resistance/dioxygenase domain-containing protein n=1 Tax=Olea europaea subsp. europaea TaxID=158383 RepID=A0A8S0TDW0_OLEEU|nr:Hypothetical predicted protein [Olea europaea subsp. europaea]